MNPIKNPSEQKDELDAISIERLHEGPHGIVFDQDLFVWNNGYLEIKHPQERGYVNTIEALAQLLTHPKPGYKFFPQDGRLTEKSEYYVLEEGPEGDEDTDVVVAIPEELVSESLSSFPCDAAYDAFTQNLREACNKLEEAQHKLQGKFPDQECALDTVRQDILTVRHSIEDRVYSDDHHRQERLWRINDTHHGFGVGVYPPIGDLIEVL